MDFKFSTQLCTFDVSKPRNECSIGKKDEKGGVREQENGANANLENPLEMHIIRSWAKANWERHLALLTTSTKRHNILEPLTSSKYR